MTTAFCLKEATVLNRASLHYRPAVSPAVKLASTVSNFSSFFQQFPSVFRLQRPFELKWLPTVTLLLKSQTGFQYGC